MPFSTATSVGCDPDSGPLSDDMKIINKLHNLSINDLNLSKGIRIACLNINSRPKYLMNVES